MTKLTLHNIELHDCKLYSVTVNIVDTQVNIEEQQIRLYADGRRQFFPSGVTLTEGDRKRIAYIALEKLQKLKSLGIITN